jgi:deoxyribodipyrimidine photo-lyase
MAVSIVWFRRDFRLTDNPALVAALAEGPVLPVYIHDPQAEGAWPPGAASRWWAHHSLAALETALAAKGARLIIRRGDSLRELTALARETGATAVHWNRLYEPAFTARDAQLKAALREQGLLAESHGAALLHEPTRIKTGGGEPYRVFTPFWKTFQRDVEVPSPVPAPRRIAVPTSAPKSLALGELPLLPKLPWANGFTDWWTPGEEGALQQLKHFLRRALKGYKEGRDYPAQTGVSYLSPHLHFGELTPRQVWHAVRGHGGSAASAAGAEAYLREIGWREFAHHVLFHFPLTPSEPLYAKYAPFPWRKGYTSLLRAWQQGETGYPIVDAGMRELWATGWMHNRARMLVASLLVKNLRIPWTEGAHWFWDTLVDADLANNTAGWQWSAGCGADAAPYLRIFNPATQAERFDAAGDYIRRWVPELKGLSGATVHAPWKAGGVKGYPAPVVDYAASRAEALEALARLKPAKG